MRYFREMIGNEIIKIHLEGSKEDEKQVET
jgi:hypothetical protein